jgi:hypothetical protein
MDPEPFVDAIEAGRFLGLRPRRVLELARSGALPAYPLGNGLRRVWRFRLSELACARLPCAKLCSAVFRAVTGENLNGAVSCEGELSRVSRIVG